jgi:glycosyltransferase involved in cell wall biosynthesis
MLTPENLFHPTLPLEVALPPVVPPAPAAPVETIRVLHVINGEYYAGAERVQDLLAKRLPEFGFSVGFACVKLDLFDELRQSREAPLYDVPMWSKFDVRVARKVAGIVRRDGYRLIHSHTVRTALIGALAAAWAGVPMVYHAHSPTSNDSTRRWHNWINGIVERISLRRAVRVIAVSEALAEHIAAEGFDPVRITVVHNGAPYPETMPERQTPTGTWTIGTAALFRPRKGLEVLLDAIAALRRQGVPVHLRAVGAFESTEYEAQIAEQLRRLHLAEHVCWTGFARDITAELQKMDLFVLPSLFGEGLPMVVLEAMAAGVPVVATRVAGVPEAIRHGQDGLIVAPGDAEQLAGAITSVTGGEFDWSALRASAMARHARLFSDRGMAAGVAAVYRKLLEQGVTSGKTGGYN